MADKIKSNKGARRKKKRKKLPKKPDFYHKGMTRKQRKEEIRINRQITTLEKQGYQSHGQEFKKKPLKIRRKSYPKNWSFRTIKTNMTQSGKVGKTRHLIFAKKK